MLHAKASLLSTLIVSAGCSSGGAGTAPDAAVDGPLRCPPPQSVGCPDPAAAPSYASQVAPTFKAVCSPCHFPGGIVANLYDFSTYVGVVNAQTAILGQLYACSMPPTGGNAKYGIAPGTVAGISSKQASTIEDWIGCGAPDN